MVAYFSVIYQGQLFTKEVKGARTRSLASQGRSGISDICSLEWHLQSQRRRLRHSHLHPLENVKMSINKDSRCYLEIFTFWHELSNRGHTFPWMLSFLFVKYKVGKCVYDYKRGTPTYIASLKALYVACLAYF